MVLGTASHFYSYIGLHPSPIGGFVNVAPKGTFFKVCKGKGTDYFYYFLI